MRIRFWGNGGLNSLFLLYYFAMQFVTLAIISKCGDVCSILFIFYFVLVTYAYPSFEKMIEISDDLLTLP